VQSAICSCGSAGIFCLPALSFGEFFSSSLQDIPIGFLKNFHRTIFLVLGVVFLRIYRGNWLDNTICWSLFFVAFVWMLFRKKAFFFSFLGKAVLFEGAYYLFILPFVIFLFTMPYSSTLSQIVGQEAALSYSLQTILVSPAFLVLYNKLKHPNLDIAKLFKWGAIGIVNFTFALWVKHLLLNIYALPINVADPVLLVGFLNSALTLLIAALVLLITFLPVIREKRRVFSSRGMGVGLVLIGVYFIIYVLVAMLNQRYFSFLELTELWAITMPIVGLSLMHKHRHERVP